jgi:hypothetical protein
MMHPPSWILAAKFKQGEHPSCQYDSPVVTGKLGIDQGAVSWMVIEAQAEPLILRHPVAHLEGEAGERFSTESVPSSSCQP